MSFKVYYLTENECIEAYKLLSIDGYCWHLGALSDETILSNENNKLNVPKEHNIVHIDRKNKYVYSSSYLDGEISEKQLKNYLLYEKGYLDLIHDEEEHRELMSSINLLKFTLIDDDYKLLKNTLGVKLEPYSLDEFSLFYFYQELLNEPVFMEILTREYISKPEIVSIDAVISKSFDEWEMNPDVDIEQFRIKQL